MFDPENQNLQRPLPFACPSCLYQAVGRCGGPINSATYSMRGNSLVTCREIERRQVFFDDLYSSVIPKPLQSFQDQIDMPAFIPGIDEGMHDTLEAAPETLFAVSLQTFLGKTGAIRFELADDLRRNLHLPTNARLALVGTGMDRRLERFWTNSDGGHVWQRIANFGFEFVTSLTFPVYDQNPRADHIYNQDRNLLTHDLFASLGVPSIPFLYPYNDEDHRDAFSWLRARPDIFKLAVLGQFYKSDRQFEQFLNNMRMIRDGIDRPIEFLVVGVAKRDRIAALMREFSATIVSWKPFDCAVYGGVGLSADLEPMAESECYGLTRDVLAAGNICRFSRACKELLQPKVEISSLVRMADANHRAADALGRSAMP